MADLRKKNDFLKAFGVSSIGKNLIADDEDLAARHADESRCTSELDIAKENSDEMLARVENHEAESSSKHLGPKVQPSEVSVLIKSGLMAIQEVPNEYREGTAPSRDMLLAALAKLFVAWSSSFWDGAIRTQGVVMDAFVNDTRPNALPCTKDLLVVASGGELAATTATTLSDQLARASLDDTGHQVKGIRNDLIWKHQKPTGCRANFIFNYSYSCWLGTPLNDGNCHEGVDRCADIAVRPRVELRPEHCDNNNKQVSMPCSKRCNFETYNKHSEI